MLVIFVEGETDKIFFKKLIEPKLNYSCFSYRDYAQEGKKKISSYLRSLQLMKNDYIFVSDLDDHNDIEFKINKLKDKYNHIDEDKIVMVIKEIEGSYLAGLTKDSLKKRKIKYTKNTTDSLSKEEFEQVCKLEPANKTSYLLDILEDYDINEAMTKNKSFNDFTIKYNLA